MVSWTDGIRQDALDGLRKRNARAVQRGRKAGVGRKAGIAVYLKNPRTALGVDAKVHAGIAGQAEDFPTGE